MKINQKSIKYFLHSVVFRNRDNIKVETMKTVETIKKAANYICKTYSLLMNNILVLVFGPEKVYAQQIVHCSEKYVITSGGCIINLDE